MEAFYFQIKKNLVNDDEIHYTINNISTFVAQYENIKTEIKKERSEAGNYKIKKLILVNNLKIISQQIIDTLNVNFSISKQVQDEKYRAGCGVRNIRVLNLPYAKLIDINVLCGKQAELIEDFDEFQKCAKLADRMIEENDGRVPKSLASTVRKKIIEAFNNDWDFRHIQWECRVNIDEYKYFKKFYHGGLCFYNKEFENQTLKDVHHADMVSAYISRMCNNSFPVSRPIKVDLDKYNTEEVVRIINNNTSLIKIYLTPDCQLKNPNINPLGSLIRKREGFLTDLDFQIFKETYAGSFKIAELYIFKRVDKLPKSIRDIMYGFFKDKQDVKALKGTEAFDEADYSIKKIKVNCTYGVFGSGIDVKYCNIFWAIYTTALQRYALWRSIVRSGLEYFIYCDTDSVFSKVKLDFSEGNELGKWEVDEFKRMIIKGNKGYVTEDKDKKLNIVLAGAVKKSVYNYIKENNITGSQLFRKNYFKNMVIPAKYEVIYRYIANDKEVYKKCYPVGKYADTMSRIFEDRFLLAD